MGKKSIGRWAAAAAALSVGLFAAYAVGADAKGGSGSGHGGGGGGGDAKNIGIVALTCATDDPLLSLDADAYFAYNVKGDKLQLALGAVGVDSAGRWTVSATDNGRAVVQGTFDFTGTTDWQVLRSTRMPKGVNDWAFALGNETTGQSCTGTWSWRV